MRKFGTLFWIAVILGASLTGCGRTTVDGYSNKSGDFSQFFLAQITKYGGHVASTGAPKLVMDWQFKSDDNGFQILFDRHNLSQFEGLLKASLGNFTLESEYPQIVYGTKSIGLQIFCNLKANPIHIICLRAGVL
jgi:hypothetical protein